MGNVRIIVSSKVRRVNVHNNYMHVSFPETVYKQVAGVGIFSDIHVTILSCIPSTNNYFILLYSFNSLANFYARFRQMNATGFRNTSIFIV